MNEYKGALEREKSKNYRLMAKIESLEAEIEHYIKLLKEMDT